MNVTDNRKRDIVNPKRSITFENIPKMKLLVASIQLSKSLCALLLATAVLVALTACRAEVNVSVDEEGEGEIELIAAVSDTIMSMAQLGGEDPFGDFLDTPGDDLESEGLEGVSVEPYSAAGYTGVRIRANFDPYDPALAAVSEGDSIIGELTDTVGIGRFNFARTENDDGWIVELNQTTDPSVADGLGELGDLAGDIPFDIGELDLPFVLSLELPGEYVEHNADREVDGVLIWDANLLEGVDISATSRDPGTQFEIVPIIITVLFVLIFGGIVIAVVVSRERRRRRAEEDVAMDT